MTILVHRTTRLVGGVLLLMLVAAGCRTYGGYGSTEAVAEEIRQAAQRFADDYARAQGERDALQRAADADPALAPLAERFAAVVARQGALVEAHQMLASDVSAEGNLLFAWVGPDAYRRLHRAYGAMLSDQQVIRDRYAEVLRDLQLAAGGTPASMVPEEGRYQVAPHFYRRIDSALGPRTVADVLARARTGVAPAAPPMAPDSTAAEGDASDTQ